MRSPINSLVAVIPVKDFDKASAWYATLLGREADLIPVDEVAEWQLAEGAWLQVSTDPERAGSTTVVFGVDDLEQQRQLCNDAGITLGDVQEYPGVIKMADICDPEGNKVSFVEDISEGN
ncbi:MAG: VOC family protein [Thalassolituus maritimus]|nr:MAG: VOC family protein [Thalassolituus maritimus]